MPKKKKPAKELTTDEAVRKLFPKKVREEVKRQAMQPLTLTRIQPRKKER